MRLQIHWFCCNFWGGSQKRLSTILAPAPSAFVTVWNQKWQHKLKSLPSPGLDGATQFSCSVSDTQAQTVPPGEGVGGVSGQLVPSVTFQNWFSFLQPKFQSVWVYLSVIISTLWVYSLNTLLALVCGPCPLTVGTHFPRPFPKSPPPSTGQSGHPHEKPPNHLSRPPQPPREAGSILL